MLLWLVVHAILARQSGDMLILIVVLIHPFGRVVLKLQGMIYQECWCFFGQKSSLVATATVSGA